MQMVRAAAGVPFSPKYSAAAPDNRSTTLWIPLRGMPMKPGTIKPTSPVRTRRAPPNVAVLLIIMVLSFLFFLLANGHRPFFQRRQILNGRPVEHSAQFVEPGTVTCPTRKRFDRE